MKIKEFNIAITGNPNTGKTSIFNLLTHQHQHVGNWPGVTVEKKEGILYKDKEKIVKITDLPGIYSLRGYSDDEIVASNFLLSKKLDLIVIVLDASKLERSLYLYTQIKELNTKIVIALNMIDIANKNGISIDINKMSKKLGVPIIETVGDKNKNIDLLKNKILEILNEKQKIVDIKYSKEVYEEINNINIFLNKKFKNKNINKLLPIKIIEKDKYFIDKYKINYKYDKNKDFQSKIIEDRWNFIKNICSQIISKNTNIHSNTITEKLDKIVTNKILCFPIFIFVIFLMFSFVYLLGNPIVSFLEFAINKINELIINFLNATSTPNIIKSLITDGIINGAGTVITFIPNIFLLFLFLGFLEDTGYLARGVFIIDRLMISIGLHGKSFIPLIMGFGCSVPAMLGTRIMEKKKDKILTMLVIPFISCSAKLPVFIIFSKVFFRSNATFIIFSLYIIGIIISILVAKILSISLFKNEKSVLVMELPEYHIPRFINILKLGWEKAYEFITKATTLIMLSVIIIWFLSNIPFGVEYASKESLIGIVGNKLSYLFKLSGYGFWQPSVALITGFLAKEMIIGTLGTLFSNSTIGLEKTLLNFFTPISAYSYLLMILLYTPCLSTILTFKQETKSLKWTTFLIIYSFLIGLLISTLFYQIAIRI